MSRKNSSSSEQERVSEAARSFEEAADLVKTIIVSVSDLIPLFLEKWSVVKDKPAYSEIQQEQRRIKGKLLALTKRQRRLILLIGLLFVWNMGLSILLVMKL